MLTVREASEDASTNSASGTVVDSTIPSRKSNRLSAALSSLWLKTEKDETSNESLEGEKKTKEESDLKDQSEGETSPLSIEVEPQVTVELDVDTSGSSPDISEEVSGASTSDQQEAQPVSKIETEVVPPTSDQLILPAEDLSLALKPQDGDQSVSLSPVASNEDAGVSTDDLLTMVFEGDDLIKAIEAFNSAVAWMEKIVGVFDALAEVCPCALLINFRLMFALVSCIGLLGSR